MSELEVFAASRGVALRAHGVLHAFDVLFEVIQGAEDVLHALSVVKDGARIIGLHVDGTTGLLGHTVGQRLDDLTGWTLKKQGMNVQPRMSRFMMKSTKTSKQILTGGPGGPTVPVSPF